MNIEKLKEIADIRTKYKTRYIYWSNKEKKWIVTNQFFASDKEFLESFYQKEDIPLRFREINKP